MHNDFPPYGCFRASIPDPKNSDHRYLITIVFTLYKRGLDFKKMIFHNNKIHEASQQKRYYGIENENIGIMVTSQEDTKAYHEASQDVPEFIKIAAGVIENNGYGQCSLIE